MIISSKTQVLNMAKNTDIAPSSNSLLKSSLNGSSIKLMSWNYLAACRQRLRKYAVFTFCDNKQADASFRELTRGQDLVLIQEAYLDSAAKQLFTDLGKDYSWDMAVSYIAEKNKNIPTGVLTLANAKSSHSFAQKNFETLLPTPKTILFTHYHLTDNKQIIDKQLLVVNIHAILLSRKHFYIQLNLMLENIKQHDGPIILAGDFNTMTTTSYLKLKQIVTSIGLTEVEIPAAVDHRVISIMGQYYDFIFYKDLDLVNTKTIDLKTTRNGKTSDHNPLFVEFKFPL
jgi:endonuclease/exonuclease/phosphatase (EEP) superfamily protein YafD